MGAIGNAIVQIGQRLFVREPMRLRHQRFDQRDELIGLLHEAFQMEAIIDNASATALTAFEQEAFELALTFGRRRARSASESMALKARARGLEDGAAFFIDEP